MTKNGKHSCTAGFIAPKDPGPAANAPLDPKHHNQLKITTRAKSKISRIHTPAGHTRPRAKEPKGQELNPKTEPATPRRKK